MRQYVNQADDVGQPPFKRGDTIVCMTDIWNTIRYGHQRTVQGCHWNRSKREWIVTVCDATPHGKYHNWTTKYTAKYFALVNLKNEEKTTMYFAMDVTSDPKVENFHLFRQIIPLFYDKSVDVLKESIKEYLRLNPENTVAIFDLAFIAEVENPRPPVRFRNMR